MQIIKRIFLNPVIWMQNYLSYWTHLQSQRVGGTSEPYDWSQDKKYY